MTTKTDDQERAAFEAWYVTQTDQDYDWWGWEEEHGQYEATHSRLSWAAWQARAAVEADRKGRMPSDELRGMADTAYGQYIQQMRSRECLGWEQKVKTGQFGEAELKAHTRAGEFLGRHRAFSECVEILSRYGSSQPAASLKHRQLREFYNAQTDDELIAAQQHHIEKLQAKLPATSPIVANRVREG